MRNENEACGEKPASPGTDDCAPSDGAQTDLVRETQPAPAPVQSGIVAHPRADLDRWIAGEMHAFCEALARYRGHVAPTARAFEAHLTTMRAAIEAERARVDYEMGEGAILLVNACIALAESERRADDLQRRNNNQARQLEIALSDIARLRNNHVR